MNILSMILPAASDIGHACFVFGVISVKLYCQIVLFYIILLFSQQKSQNIGHVLEDIM